MSLARITSRTAALLALGAVAACSDPIGPTVDYIDTQAAAAKVQPVMDVMQQPTLASFAILADVEGVPAAASAAPITALAQLTSAAARGKWDRSAPLLARSAVRSADVLPGDVRGNTYVYNSTSDAYEVSTTRTDAPAEGIRVVLYAVDVLSGTVAEPVVEIGHVDLVDESNAAQNRLNVVLVRSNGATLMDYDITHTVTASSESFSIAGSATNGTTPVVFSLEGMVGENTSSLTFDLEAETVGFNVHAGVTVNGLTQQATIETSLGYDGHTLSFALTVHANGMDGEIKFDGMRYATLSMVIEETPGSVTATTTFIKANGRPMTVAEIEAISALFADALELDAFWLGLVWPLGALAPPPAI